MPKLSDKIEIFTDSVIRRMTRICDEYGAINLSQGFPDFPPPVEITNALKRVAEEGPHQYSVTSGAPDFKAALAEKMSKSFGRTVDPEKEVLVTCGGTEAMMATMLAICNPGDKVIVFSPFYENYGVDTLLSGAEPIFIPLNPPEYDFNREQLEKAFQQGIKGIILCNPSNPCGKVFTKEELTFIGRLAEKYDSYIITDEVYEHIVYPPYEHTYMAALPGMAERTITCSSLSKTYSITGWRLGTVIAAPDVIEAISKVHDFLTVGAPAPLQAAAIAGLKIDDTYYEYLQTLYLKKRDFFLAGLDLLNIRHNVPAGTYFVMVDISPYLEQEKFRGMSDLEFCEWMIRELGVAAVPGSSFFHENVNHLIRLHFAREEATLAEALRRLKPLAR